MRMIFGKIIQGFLILLDKIRGTDFHKMVIERVGGGYYYECTHLRILPQLRRVCSKVTSEDSIIDVGCGKGRMLAWFSQFAFGRVDGIELNTNLISIAENNLTKMGLPSDHRGGCFCGGGRYPLGWCPLLLSPGKRTIAASL